MAERTKLSGEKAMKRKPEEIVLEDIIIPFLREDLGYALIHRRLQRVPIRFGRETKYADTVVYIIKNAKKVPHVLVEKKDRGTHLVMIPFCFPPSNSDRVIPLNVLSIPISSSKHRLR